MHMHQLQNYTYSIEPSTQSEREYTASSMHDNTIAYVAEFWVRDQRSGSGRPGSHQVTGHECTSYGPW